MIRPFLIAAVFGVASAFAGPGPALAQDANDEVIFDSCLSDLGLSPDECACVVEGANAELNDLEHDFFVAHLLEDEAMVMELEPEMSEENIDQVMWFADYAPEHCSGMN